MIQLSLFIACVFTMHPSFSAPPSDICNQESALKKILDYSFSLQKKEKSPRKMMIYLKVRLRQCERLLSGQTGHLSFILSSFLNQIYSLSKERTRFFDQIKEISRLPFFIKRLDLLSSYGIILEETDWAMLNLRNSEMGTRWINALKAARAIGNLDLSNQILKELMKKSRAEDQDLFILHRSTLLKSAGEFEKALSLIDSVDTTKIQNRQAREEISAWKQLAKINVLIDQKKLSEGKVLLSNLSPEQWGTDSLLKYESELAKFYLSDPKTGEDHKTEIQQLIKLRESIDQVDIIFNPMRNLELYFLVQKYWPSPPDEITSNLLVEIRSYPLYLRYPFLSKNKIDSEDFKNPKFKNDYIVQLIKARNL